MNGIYLIEFTLDGFGCRRVVIADGEEQARDLSDLTDIAIIDSIKKIGIADAGVETGLICAEEP